MATDVSATESFLTDESIPNFDMGELARTKVVDQNMGLGRFTIAPHSAVDIVTVIKDNGRWDPLIVVPHSNLLLSVSHLSPPVCRISAISWEVDGDDIFFTATPSPKNGSLKFSLRDVALGFDKGIKHIPFLVVDCIGANLSNPRISNFVLLEAFFYKHSFVCSFFFGFFFGFF